MNKQKLIRWKVYLDRSKMYIGYVQFFLIILVFIQSMESNPVSEFVQNNIIISIPLILAIFVFLSLVVGYVDSRLGLREEEIRNHSQSNPILRDIKESLASLHEEVKELREQIENEKQAEPEGRAYRENVR